jgi:hypothetical protein
MNERIRELINESTCFKEGDTEGKYDIEVFDKEKFAELIVRKCADIGQQYADGNYEVPNQIFRTFWS